jgi:hypothetical protein
MNNDENGDNKIRPSLWGHKTDAPRGVWACSCTGRVQNGRRSTDLQETSKKRSPEKLEMSKTIFQNFFKNILREELKILLRFDRVPGEQAKTEKLI